MSSLGSRAKIAAVSVAILGAALSAVFLFRQDPSPGRPDKPAAEQSHLAAASPPERVVTTAGAREKPARAVPTTASRVAETPALPGKQAFSFEVPDCPQLTLVAVTDGTATVQAGDTEPEKVRVGDLLESGEVTFIGKHPDSGAPIVLLEDEDKVACRARGFRPLAGLTRIGPTSPRDFAARTGVTGDPNRVETMVLKLAPGTNAARADFGSAARQR